MNKTELRRVINTFVTDSSNSTVQTLCDWINDGKISQYNKVISK